MAGAGWSGGSGRPELPPPACSRAQPLSDPTPGPVHKQPVLSPSALGKSTHGGWISPAGRWPGLLATLWPGNGRWRCRLGNRGGLWPAHGRALGGLLLKVRDFACHKKDASRDRDRDHQAEEEIATRRLSWRLHAGLLNRPSRRQQGCIDPGLGGHVTGGTAWTPGPGTVGPAVWTHSCWRSPRSCVPHHKSRPPWAAHWLRVRAYSTSPSSSPSIRTGQSATKLRTKRSPAFSITRCDAA